jgi:hypothetical protein
MAVVKSRADRPGSTGSGAGGGGGVLDLPKHILLKSYIVGKYFCFPHGFIKSFHVLIIGAIFIAQDNVAIYALLLHDGFIGVL